MRRAHGEGGRDKSVGNSNATSHPETRSKFGDGIWNVTPPLLEAIMTARTEELCDM
jgi:hypothetical protein